MLTVDYYLIAVNLSKISTNEIKNRKKSLQRIKRSLNKKNLIYRRNDTSTSLIPKNLLTSRESIIITRLLFQLPIYKVFFDSYVNKQH